MKHLTVFYAFFGIILDIHASEMRFLGIFKANGVRFTVKREGDFLQTSGRFAEVGKNTYRSIR